MRYLVTNWDDLSKEFCKEKPKLQHNIDAMKNVQSNCKIDMDRLLSDADSSMMQMFARRIEEIEGPLSEGEKYQRVKDFKNYLLDEFNMTNQLLERYIDEELWQNHSLKLLRYDRIIMKYTTKFKLSKKERHKYTLHEFPIDTADKRMKELSD